MCSSKSFQPLSLGARYPSVEFFKPAHISIISGINTKIYDNFFVTEIQNLTAFLSLEHYVTGNHLLYMISRLDNCLKENRTGESIFGLVKIIFIEYEIVAVEKEITTIVDGQEITGTILEKEFIIIREI